MKLNNQLIEQIKLLPDVENEYLEKEKKLIHPPTITDSEIELQAKEFRKANLLSVSFTPDVHSFITGAKAVLSMMPQSEGWVKVEDVPTDRVLEVLLFNANQAPHLQHIIKGTWFLESKSFKHSQLSFYEPSHWMPLPKHP